MAHAVAREIKVSTTHEEHKRLIRSRTVDPAAHEAFLKGMSWAYKQTPDGYKKAIDVDIDAIKKEIQEKARATEDKKIIRWCDENMPDDEAGLLKLLNRVNQKLEEKDAA